MDARVAHWQGCLWLIQPLLDAGLDLEDVTGLVSRLAFEAVVAGPELDDAVCGLVADRPPAVRAAWTETIHRMITVPAPRSPA